MKMKRICLILLSLFFITACGKQENVNKQVPKNLIAVSNLKDILDGEIKECIEVDNNTLNIGVSYNETGVNELHETVLDVDKSKSDKFIYEIIYQGNVEVKESYTDAGEHRWDCMNDNQIRETCILDGSGWIEYYDIYNNINCPYIDGEHIFEYGYITSEVPGKMEKSAKDVGEEYEGYLAEYSCLSFNTWNALAGYEAELEEGCYNISFQAAYDNLPITLNLGTDGRKFSIDMVYGNEKMIQLQGPLFYKATKQRTVNEIVNPLQIISSIKNDFVLYTVSENSTVEINNMELEYFPMEKEDGSYLLIPVWNFSCTDTRYESTQNNEKEEINLNYHYIYYAEDGKLCGVFY